MTTNRRRRRHTLRTIGPRSARPFPPPLVVVHRASTALQLGTTTASSAAADAASSPAAVRAFDAVLHVPALAVCVLIAAVFGALQWRVRAIESAVADRTVALRQLRRVKASELSGGTVDASAPVRDAVADYERAHRRVEALRTLAPGVVLRFGAPPDAQGSGGGRGGSVDENTAAAQQFLGIPPPAETERSGDGRLSNLLIAVLVLVALSQLTLLVFLVATDPMASSTTSGVDSHFDLVGGLL